MLYDLHVHTNYCDGNNTPEEMVLSAIEKGLDCLGFSGHGYCKADESYCMSRETTEKYITEIKRLKEQYSGSIKILCGIEKGYYSEESNEPFDYVIGSVHNFKFGEEFIPVDESEDILRYAAEKYCGGDFYALAEKYFETAGDVLRKTGADIIGHFDLIAKFNENGRLFDENDERYKKAWKAAIDALLPYGKPFELNTGAISRGYRTEPYPNREMREYIKSRGGKLILSSDSHSAENIAFGFDRWSGEI